MQQECLDCRTGPFVSWASHMVLVRSWALLFAGLNHAVSEQSSLIGCTLTNHKLKAFHLPPNQAGVVEECLPGLGLQTVYLFILQALMLTPFQPQQSLVQHTLISTPVQETANKKLPFIRVQQGFIVAPRLPIKQTAETAGQTEVMSNLVRWPFFIAEIAHLGILWPIQGTSATSPSFDVH